MPWHWLAINQIDINIDIDDKNIWQCEIKMLCQNFLHLQIWKEEIFFIKAMYFVLTS